STLRNASIQTNVEYVQFYNLSIHQGVALLSSFVNPTLYLHQSHFTSKTYSWETTTMFRNGIEYRNVSVSTGDDYPKWWIQYLSSSSILSDRSINVQEQEQIATWPSTRMQEQGVQTERKHSHQQSSLTEKNSYYDFDENNRTRIQTTSGYSSQNEHAQSKTNSRLSDCYCSDLTVTLNNNNKRADRSSSSEYLSNKEDDRNRNNISSQNHTPSRGGDQLGYRQFKLSLNTLPARNYHSSTNHSGISSHLSSSHRLRSSCRLCNARNRTSSEVSTTLDNRYHRPVTTTWDPISTTIFVDDEIPRRQTRTHIESDASYIPMSSETDRILEIDRIIAKYQRQASLYGISHRSKTAMELYRDDNYSVQSSRRNSTNIIPMSRSTKAKYSLIKPSSDDMINTYTGERCSACMARLLAPRMNPLITRSSISDSSLIKPDYIELDYTDHWSPWIRYNEQRINDLQKRIELLLQTDDDQDLLAVTAPSLLEASTKTVTQHIDDILLRNKYDEHYRRLSSYVKHRPLTYHSSSDSSITHANDMLNYSSYYRYIPRLLRPRRITNYGALLGRSYRLLPPSSRLSTHKRSVRVSPTAYLRSLPVSSRFADYLHHRLRTPLRSILHHQTPAHYSR
ncbi:unnamed protein product, partial [Didymodactylos carnosus]